MAKQLNVNLAFTADIGQAKVQLQDLQNQLSKLTSTTGSGNKLGLTKELSEATVKVTELQSILKSATSSTGKLDIGAFSQGLKKSGTDLKEYAKILNSLGPEGSKAFSSLARSITSAEIPLRKANGLLSEMWTTMKNTARWQITSSVLHNFIGGLQSAVGYAKDLNKTLTDIRIVAPEKSIEDMAKFAKLANQQAKELSSTTLDYAKGALIYYQQGLDDAMTKERTDVTTKMANVTGDAVDEVSSYMTSIWNNFNKEGDYSAEHFADILTKLGAETAASTTEITDALSKYTGVANTIGLSYESATAAATTLIDRMRETPEVAGTALKTVFARMEGLKLDGETSEGGLNTSLNKYSEALAAIGVSIKDQNDEMRQADDILMDMGEKWQGLAQDQKIAVAETVAGIRQWQQFSALMDNFDYFKQYKELAATGSEGALQEQQDIYAESWEAASNRVKSSVQSIYMELLNDKFFIKMLNMIADLTNGFDQLIQNIGGLKTILPLIGTLMLKAFGKNIADSMSNFAYNIKASKKGFQEIIAEREKANKVLMSSVIDYGDQGHANGAMAKVYSQQATIQDALIEKQKELNKLGTQLTEQEQRQAELLIDMVASKGQLAIQAAQELEQNEKNFTQYENNLKAEDIANQRKGNQGYSRVGTNGLQLETFSLEDDINRLKELESQASLAQQTWNRFRDDFKVAIDSGNDEEIQKLQQELQQFLEELEETGTVSDICAEKMQQLFAKMADGNATIEDVDANIGELSADAIIHYERMVEAGERSFNGNSEALKRFIAELNRARQGARETGLSMEELARRSQESSNGINAATEALSRFSGQATKISQGLVKIGNSAMQMGMALQAVKSLKTIWNDEDISNGERYLQLLISMGMILPGIHSAFEMLNSSITAISNAFKAGGAISSLIALIGPGGIVFLAAAALTALGVIIYKVLEKKRENEPVKKLEELKKASESTEKQLDAVNTKIGEIDSSLQNLSSKKDSLENLEKGTAKWRETLSDANNELLDTIDNVNDLSENLSDNDLAVLNELYEGGASLKEGIDYIKNADGAWEFTDIGEAKIQSIKAMTVANAKIEVNSAKIAENRQQQKIDEVKLGKQLAEAAGTFKEKIYTNEEISEMSGTQRHRLGIYKTKDGDYQGNPEVTTQGYLTEDQGIIVLKEISSFMQNHGYYSTDQLRDANSALYEQLFDQGIIDEDVRRAIIHSEELQQAIGDHVNNINTLKEQEASKASEDLLSANDGDLSKRLYGYIDPVTGEKVKADIDSKYKDYISGMTQVMGEDVIKLRDQYVEHPYKNQIYSNYEGSTYKEQKESAKEAFLKEGGYEKTDKGYKNAEGTEIETKDLDSEVANWVAYKKAIDDVNISYEDYKKELKDSDEDWKALDKIKNIFKNTGKNIDKLSDKFKKLKKDGNTASKTFQNAKEELDDFAEEIKGPLSEALDVDPKNTVIDGEFVAENLDTIKAAMNGNLDALEELRDAYSQAQVDQIFKVNFDEESFEAVKDQLHERVAEIENDLDDIAIGTTIDNQNIIDGTNELIQTCARTKQDAQNILDGLGIDADIEEVTVPAEDFEGQMDNLQQQEHYNGSIPLFGSSIEVSEDGNFESTANQIGSLPLYSYQWQKQNPTTSKKTVAGDSVVTWQIKPTDKGGKAPTKKQVTLPRASAGKQSSKGAPSGSRNTGSRGGGGSRGSRRQVRRIERARKQSEKSTVIKRYKEIEDKIERNAKESERLAKIQDKLYGKARLNQMDQVNKKHLEEIKLLQKKTKEARQYYLNDKRDAKEALQNVINASKKAQATNKHERLTPEQKKALNAINDLQFNDFGEITNYTTVMKALQDQLNAYERVYNEAANFKRAEDQSKYKEDIIDPLKDKIDKLQEAIDQYDETRELMEDLKDQIDEAYTAWQEANYEKLQYALELNITINDNDLKLLDYYFGKINNNVFKAAEAFDMYFDNIGEYSFSMEDKVTLITDDLKTTLDELKTQRKELIEEAKQAKIALDEASSIYSTSSKVTGKKNKKGKYIEYNGYSYGNWLDAKKQYEKALKLFEIGKLSKKKFNKIKSRFDTQDKYKKAYDEALAKYKEAVKKGGVTAAQAQEELNKITLTDAEKEKLANAKKGYSNKSQTNKYNKAKKAYNKALKDWKNHGKKTSGKYYNAVKKAWDTLEKVKENFNKKYNENKYKQAKKAWKKHGKKKSGKYWKAYQEQLQAKQAYQRVMKEFSNKYSKENYDNALKAYEAAKEKLNKISKKKNKKKWKKQKTKVNALKATLKTQELLKEQYELWNQALENAKLIETNIDAQQKLLDQQTDAASNVSKTLTEYNQLSVVGGKVGAVTKAIWNQVEAYIALEDAFHKGEIQQKDLIEGLQSSYDVILDQCQALQDLKDEMSDYYSNTLSNVNQELDKYNNKLGYQQELVSHLKTLAELGNKESDWNLQERFILSDMTVANGQAAIYQARWQEMIHEYDAMIEKQRFAEEELNDFKSDQNAYMTLQLSDVSKEIIEAEKKLNEAKKSGIEKDIQLAEQEYNTLIAKQEALQGSNEDAVQTALEERVNIYKKATEAAEEAAMEARNNMFSSLEQAMEDNSQLLENSLNRAAEAMKKALVSISGGFEELSRQMNLTASRQEEFLTKTNQNYELNKMQRNLQKDIDKTNNKNAKIRFANFSKELRQLEEKDKLSNLELEIAQKKYDLLKAQIELEDSQNAKQIIRLSKDSEGNYGYVYVANEEQIEDAKQAVEDAENALYNLQLDATNNYGQKYLQIAQEYQDALIEAQQITNQQEREERIAALKAQYEPWLEDIKTLYQTGYTATDYLEDALKRDSWLYDNYNNQVVNVTTNLSALDTYIEEANGAWEVFNATMEQIYSVADFWDLTTELLKNTQDVTNETLGNFQVALGDINAVLESLHQKLANFADDVLPVLNNQITETEATLRQLNETIKYWATHDTTGEGYETFNQFFRTKATSYSYVNGANGYKMLYSTGGEGPNALIASKWNESIMAYNEAQAQKLSKSVYTGGYYGFTDEGRLEYILNADKDSDEYKKWITDKKILETSIAALASGGYTGEWPADSTGKLAVLHEKELVLNADDTQNILAAIAGVRELAAAGFLSNLNSVSLTNPLLDSQKIEQSIHIDAQFPGVTDRYEIEQAFNNLANRAIQYANRK